jgi:IS30 family transposase
LERIDHLISPLIKKGQSINHIYATHSEEIGVSKKTLYTYINENIFLINNFDLPKKVRYRARRKKKSVLTRFEYKYRRGRSLEDYQAYIKANPDLPVVEMDTVKSAHGSLKALLTFIFTKSNFMLVFLLNDATQNSVEGVFDWLTNRLGTETFRKLFPIILTDNGVEFKNPHVLEFTEAGIRRTHIFYCDPQASWQKAHVEKNHVLIRRIIPKGTSFQKLTQEDINLVMCHVNSFARELFDYKTPFELMNKPEHKKLLEVLSLHQIPHDEVCMKPKLLKR